MAVPDATISAAAMRVVKLLVGNRPQTIAELMDATGVTRTAVTEQLNELVAAGFVERGLERACGRGRPRYLYATTEAATTLLFANHQRLVVPAIWDAIREVGGDKLARDVLRRVSRSVAEHYNQRIKATEPKQRLRELIDVMTQEGAQVDARERDGHLEIFKRTCPFLSMVDDKRTVCSIDLESMSLVVGKPVRRKDCRHSGAPCCSFEIAEQNGK